MKNNRLQNKKYNTSVVKKFTTNISELYKFSALLQFWAFVLLKPQWTSFRLKLTSGNLGHILSKCICIIYICIYFVYI